MRVSHDRGQEAPTASDKPFVQRYPLFSVVGAPFQ